MVTVSNLWDERVIMREEDDKETEWLKHHSDFDACVHSLIRSELRWLDNT